MLKIETRTKPGKQSPCIAVNGRIDNRSFVYHAKDDSRVTAHLYDTKIASLLAEARVEDLEVHFVNLALPCEVEWSSDFDDIDITFFAWYGKQHRRLRKDRRVSIELRPDWEHWAKPFSIAEYAEAISRATKVVGKRGIRYFEADELISNGFGIECRMNPGNPRLCDEIDRCVDSLRIVCEEAEKLLACSARKHSITTFFHFPPAIRTSCEQYLLYFVQFLEDLGVSATAEIKEQARHVLFSVTPSDGPTALQQIREALEVYLTLPGMPGFDSAAVGFSDIAIGQLHANILHLQSQLMLARATLVTKDAAIENLQLTNYQYRQMLSSSDNTKPETEALIGDTVHVTAVEGRGVRIDLPLILKRLKRVFS